jgi:hypothetical protein
LLLPTYILLKQRRLKNNLLPAGKIGFASFSRIGGIEGSNA